MNSKERALRAFNHEEPDRVPLEGIAWGEWSYPFLEKVLLPHFRLEKVAGSVIGFTEELDLLARMLGIDFRAVSSDPPTDFQRRAVSDPLFHNPWGVRVAPDTLEDEWGIQRQLNATRTQSRIVKHPLKGVNSLDEYTFPDAEAPGRFDTSKKLVKTWRDEYAISAIWGGDGFFSQAWYLRGFEAMILDMQSNPSFVDRLLDELLRFYVSIGMRFAEMGADILCIADDVAMQTGLIISPRLWRRYVKPRMLRLVSAVKQKGMYVIFHSDGNLEPLIPDLIEIGIDALNPVQPECMNPVKIKELYGDKLCLSGTISMQETLPFGTVEDVRNEVEERIATCGAGGGLIISPSNQATIDVKLENFVAVYETAKKFGRYPTTQPQPAPSQASINGIPTRHTLRRHEGDEVESHG
jgi:uroporphyrinogen decarboxylase